MIKITLITPWIEVVELDETFRNPEVMEDYPYTAQGESYKDITAQPVENIMPQPNTFVAEMTRTEATVELIRNDSKYLILSEEPA